MNLSNHIKVPSDVMDRRVGDETVILNLASGAYYGLDPVGARMWELMSAGHSLAEIRDRLLEEYEVEADRFEQDLLELVADLRSQGLIQLNED